MAKNIFYIELQGRNPIVYIKCPAWRLADGGYSVKAVPFLSQFMINCRVTGTEIRHTYVNMCTHT